MSLVDPLQTSDVEAAPYLLHENVKVQTKRAIGPRPETRVRRGLLRLPRGPT